MLKIDNIEKILAINSQPVEVMSWDWDNDYYRFDFIHNNIHSTTFRVHMRRNPQWKGGNEYIMEFWDGIKNPSLVYQYSLDNVKDPFALLSFLKDVIHDWDIVTNK